MMMKEWGIPFDHIEENWTERQYQKMAYRLTERLKRENNPRRHSKGGKR